MKLKDMLNKMEAGTYKLSKKDVEFLKENCVWRQAQNSVWEQVKQTIPRDFDLIRGR